MSYVYKLIAECLWSLWKIVTGTKKLEDTTVALGKKIEDLEKQYGTIKMEMAQAEEKHQNLEEKHQDLRERVARLQAQFDHLNDNIRGIDQELTKVRDRLLTHEREGIKEQGEIRIEQEQIRSQLQRILDRLDWMLGDIQRSRQVWADQPSDPEVQRLLEVLRNASNQIGGKRRSIKTLLEKLTDPTPKSGVGDA